MGSVGLPPKEAFAPTDGLGAGILSHAGEFGLVIGLGLVDQSFDTREIAKLLRRHVSGKFVV